MYNINNLGRYGHIVAEYADYNGYIPEAGDRYEDFTYPLILLRSGYFTEKVTREQWGVFVASAVSVTKIASRAIEAWQKEDKVTALCPVWSELI